MPNLESLSIYKERINNPLDQTPSKGDARSKTVQVARDSIPVHVRGAGISSFGMHFENGNLGSINFLHLGAEKLWYIIPKEENYKLENFCKKVSKNFDCTFYLRHKTLMIPPSILKKNGIKFARVCLTSIFFSFYFPPMCYYSYLSILFY